MCIHRPFHHQHQRITLSFITQNGSNAQYNERSTEHEHKGTRTQMYYTFNISFNKYLNNTVNKITNCFRSRQFVYFLCIPSVFSSTTGSSKKDQYHHTFSNNRQY